MLQGRTIFTLPLEGSCMRCCMSSHPFTSHTYVEGMTIFILIMWTEMEIFFYSIRYRICGRDCVEW